MTASRSDVRSERHQVVIVGGGQAGLVAGFYLSRIADTLILDASGRTGDSWRNRWDSLQLFTPARYSSLPGLPFPGDPYHLPKREAVADYLETYARIFNLPIRHGAPVSRVRSTAAGFEIEAAGLAIEARHVIVATGPFQTPKIPAFARAMAPDVVQLHSSQYKNPSQLPPGDVLVVGAGNSGAQIALELSRSRTTTLAGRAVGSLPRRILGRDVFDWLWPTVMRFESDGSVGRHVRARVLRRTDALIGMTERDLSKAGVRRADRIIGVRDGKPGFADGTLSDARSIVWATGFAPDYRWIDSAPLTLDGHPIHHRGITTLRGLYFLGLRFLHRINSSLIGGVDADAAYLSHHIAQAVRAS